MAKKKGFKRLQQRSGEHFQVEQPEEPTDYNKLRPIFSLKHMIYQGCCCVSQCKRKDKSLILDKIQKLSQSTWNDIRGLRKEMGFEKIPQHRFKVPLPRVLTPEVPIMVTRYNSEGGRMAGFRERDIFHIVLVGKDLYSH